MEASKKKILKKKKLAKAPVKKDVDFRHFQKHKKSHNRGSRQRGYRKPKFVEDRTALDTDPRRSDYTVDVTQTQTMSNVNPAAVFDVHMNMSGLSGIATAVVSEALSRGYQQVAEFPTWPFFSLVYMTQFMIDRISNTEVSVSEIPYWLACICDAISPKRVRHKAGVISYKFIVDQDDASSVVGCANQIGPTPYALKWNAGVPTNVKVNDLWTVLDVSQTYSPTEGKKAFAALTQFLAQINERSGQKSMHRLVPSNTKTKFINDASAFAQYVGYPGGGYYDTGAFLKLVGLESWIKSPLLAVFAPSSSTLGLYREGRHPNVVIRSAGDSIYAGGMVSTVLTEEDISSKTTPHIYCIDINEFISVLARCMVEAGTNAVNDGIVLSGEQFNPDVIVDKIQAKMTFQEFQLIVRATLMNNFSGSQFATQGIYPIVPSSATDNQFVALASGVGTCPIATSTGMLWPELLAENARLLTEKINTAHKAGLAIYSPCAGLYYKDELQANDYQVTYKWAPGGGTPETITVPVFKPDVEFSNPASEKGKGKKKVGAEIPINLVDGSSSSGYLMINDPGGLNKLISIWNEYMNGMSSFYSQITAIGTDAGISSLMMGIFTTMWQPTVQTDKPSSDKSSRFKKAHLADSVYSNKQIMTVYSARKPETAQWTSIQNVLISPILRAQVGSGPTNNTSFQAIAAALDQVYEIPAVVSDTPFTLAERHNQLALLCVKDRNAPPNSINKFLEEEAKKGRGGILSSIAKAFVPSVAKLVEQGLDKVPY